MSKALCSYPKSERKAVIERRLRQPQDNRGLVYWAAVDSQKRHTSAEQQTGDNNERVSGNNEQSASVQSTDRKER